MLLTCGGISVLNYAAIVQFWQSKFYRFLIFTVGFSINIGSIQISLLYNSLVITVICDAPDIFYIIAILKLQRHSTFIKLFAVKKFDFYMVNKPDG